MALPQSIDRLSELIKETSKKISYAYTAHLNKKSLNEAVEINKCAGQLGVCENEFKKIIRVQCKAVRDARAEGFNESVQMQIVTESAVGYLLVREARFAVSTIRSFDSLEIANDLLESSALTIQGKRRSAMDSLSKLTKKRGSYEYIYSADAYEEKLKRVQGFIEELIRTGDIDKCIREEKNIQNEKKEDEAELRPMTETPQDAYAPRQSMEDEEPFDYRDSNEAEEESSIGGFSSGSFF